MQLNDKTLAVLKNFAAINQNIVFRGTSTIKTIAEARNIVAEATLDAYPEKTFGIYDLNEFIATLGLVDNPKLDFKNDYVLISDSSGRSGVKYFFSDENMLTTPTKEVRLPSEEIKFILDQDTLSKIKKASATLGHTDLNISPRGKSLQLMVGDLKNKTSNAYTIDIAGEFDSQANFNMIVSIANLKMLPGDYEVLISKKLFMQLISKSDPVQYWIALEKSSEYR